MVKEYRKLEQKHYLTQAIASFSGSLILAPINLQNIKDSGNNALNVVTFGIVALLLLNGLLLLISALISSRWTNAYARTVISAWGLLPLAFFGFSLIMGVVKLAGLSIVFWQLVVFTIIGLILFFTNAVVLFLNMPTKASQNKIEPPTVS